MSNLNYNEVQQWLLDQNLNWDGNALYLKASNPKNGVMYPYFSMVIGAALSRRTSRRLSEASGLFQKDGYPTIVPLSCAFGRHLWMVSPC